jgi:hypothetical protein
MTRIAETAVAGAIVAWLQERGWDVHQEVETFAGQRADILAVNAQGHVWVIETKTSLTFDLLGQASDQRICSHYVSIGIPATKNDSRRSRALARDWLTAEGIGLIEVVGLAPVERLEPRVTVSGRLAEGIRSHWNFRNHTVAQMRADQIARVKKRLCDETRKYAKAGNNESRYWSTWKETERAVREALQALGSPTLAELAKHVNDTHRYLKIQPRNIYGWFYSGLIKGVDRVEGRPLRFKLAESKKEVAA